MHRDPPTPFAPRTPGALRYGRGSLPMHYMDEPDAAGPGAGRMAMSGRAQTAARIVQRLRKRSRVSIPRPKPGAL
jgi:hypothetical protein